MDDITPPTQSSGSLVPPPVVPPTALALATPEPPPAPHSMRRTPYTRSQAMQNLLRRTLDTVDDLADTLAEGLGLR
jgi:hypothetical protein